MVRESAVAAVYPIEDVAVTRAGRATDTDITKLHVPLPYMFTIIGLAVAIVLGIVRIDMRISVMEAKEESREKVEAANSRADTMLYDNLKQSVDDLRKQTQLLQLQYQSLQGLDRPTAPKTVGR